MVIGTEGRPLFRYITNTWEAGRPLKRYLLPSFRRKPESGSRLVPDFRRDDAWTPAFAGVTTRGDGI